MNDQYSMFPPATLPDSLNAISSPGSASGPTPSGAPDGPTISLCGPVPVLANLSARQAKEAGLLTSGTYGRVSSISSASAALMRSLANRLARKTALLGSTMYALTWKERVTPWGYRISALRASVRRTSDNGCTSWPTPDCPNGGRSLPEGTTITGMSPSGRKVQVGLQNVALLVPWSTPRVSDLNGGSMRRVRGAAGEEEARHQLREEVVLVGSGPMPNGCGAETTSGGRLNPAHSRWLMGLPPEWDACAVTAMQSLPRSRKRS